MSQPFLLGVNYWPRRKAMGWWADFDPGEVAEEFALIAELGLDMVRIFLLWETFQPAPDRVASQPLADLVRVCDIAAAAGLSLDITFFTGHMSGPNWAPAWLLDPAAPRSSRQVVSGGRPVASGYRNPYTDPVALRAEALLLDAVVGALRDHPAVGIWNLGNEPDLFAEPPDADTGRDWVAARAAQIRTLDPHHPVACGLHADSLLRTNGLRVDQVFAATDLAVMHAYPMYLDWAREPLDPELVPFSCALTTALCGKPTLMEEFGGCTAPPGAPSQVWAWQAYGHLREQFMASEEDLAVYIAAVLPRLVEVGATGALLWCFADYAPELWGRPPCDESRHERHFGLVRPDGTLKPHAAQLRAFAATRPMVQVASRALPPLDAEHFYQEPLAEVRRLYAAWCEGGK